MKIEKENVVKEVIEYIGRCISTDENLSGFWKLIEYLVQTKTLVQNCDYKVLLKETIIRRFFQNGVWMTEEIVLDQPCKLLYFNQNQLVLFYKAKFLIQPGEKRMPISTLKFYLHHSPEFVCETKKESFQKIDYRTGKQENDLGLKKRTSTTALIFYLDSTGLHLGTTN
ncbi:MAG TPA: hypothetical protein VFC67_22085 [Prolixibacteraceae bacterium]|nr:hypothetical protein [Prolixibacteraceae bacterium]